MAIFAPVRTLFFELIDDFKTFSWSSSRALISIKASIACVLALLIVLEFNISDPTWAALTAFVVVQASRGAAIVQTIERIFTTLIGVLAALLLLNLFGDNVLVMLLFAIAGLTICFYFSAKSKTPFVWVFGPVTFLLVLFSAPNVEPGLVANFAYYRALDISVGTLCGLGVSLLFATPLATEELQKNNIALLQSLNRLVGHCFKLYRDHIRSDQFKPELDQLLKLTETQAVLLRFAKHEQRFQSALRHPDLQLEQVVFMAQEMLINLYEDDGSAHELVACFSAQLGPLEKAMTHSFEAMVRSLETQCQNREEVLHQLDLWGKAMAGLMQKTSRFRDDQGAQFSSLQWIKWDRFLMHQEELFTLMRSFYEQELILPDAEPHSKGWRHLFLWDAYHWEYAFKTALAGVLFPFFALYFSLPSGVMLSVVVIISLQVDMSITRQKLFLLVVGSGLGALAALVLLGLNLENIWLYLAAIGVVVFLIGLILHGDPSRSLIGLFALFAFLGGVGSGIGPLLDWRNIVLLFLEISAAAFILQIFLVWIWPFSPRKIFQHYYGQVVWYQEQIRASIRDSLPHNPSAIHAPMRQEFNSLRQQIRSFEVYNWEGNACQQTMRQVVVLWYRSYHLLAGIALALQTLDLSAIESPLAHFIQEILATHPSSASLQRVLDELMEYKRQLRARFVAGERIPFADALRLVHIFDLLEKLARCRQDLLVCGSAIGQEMG